MGGRHRDLVFRSGEAKGRPALPLATERVQLVYSGAAGRKIVAPPSVCNGDQLCAGDAGLFPKLASCGRDDIFSGVNTALRQRPIGPFAKDFRVRPAEGIGIGPAGEDKPFDIEQADPDVRAIGKIRQERFTLGRIRRSDGGWKTGSQAGTAKPAKAVAICS